MVTTRRRVSRNGRGESLISTEYLLHAKTCVPNASYVLIHLILIVKSMGRYCSLCLFCRSGDWSNLVPPVRSLEDATPSYQVKGWTD